VIGVDMTPAMLERARNSAKKAGLHQVEFRQGFAESLPVEDSSIDVILSNCVINLCEDKGLVFQEAYRVLAPNGRLEISDIVFSGTVPTELRLQMDGWAECITGALPEAEYLDLIKQAGFTNIQVRRSQTYGEVDNMPIYGVLVSAQKP
jgi:SAM-dependent methyltransferase